MAVEKISDPGIRIEDILQFHETVSLVVIDEKFDGNAASSQSAHHLFCFAKRNAWIIRSMNDHQRRGDFVHVMDRRDAGQKFTVTLETAVFSLAVRTSIGTGIFQKRDKVA